jgi:hypothetical protein
MTRGDVHPALVQALHALVRREQGAWLGTCTELVAELNGLAAADAMPQHPRALSCALRRLAPTLRAAGIKIFFWGNVGKRRKRLVELCSRDPVKVTIKH